MFRAALLIGLLLVQSAWAQDVRFAHVPLDGTGVPADDLIDPQTGRMLDPEQASRLSNLHALNPKEDPVAWTNVPPAPLDPALDDRLPLQSGDTVDYTGKIDSQSGLLRMAVRLDESRWGPTIDSRFLHVLMHVNLHEILLRTALLRKLGYRLPAIKYLPEVTVRFPTKTDKEDFLAGVVDDTRFGEARWIKSQTETVVTFQDVAVMSTALETMHLALGIPSGQLSSRLQRSLAVPYSVAFSGESINKMDWVAGRVNDGDALLTHDDGSDFDCTLPDALWMSNRVLALSAADWAEVVDYAKFPGPVAKLVLQKVLSRRNSLIDLFDLKGSNAHGARYAKLPVKTDVTEEPHLKKGKIVNTDYWPGYASRFAHGDPDNPLEGTPWLLLSKAQAVGFQSLFDLINTELPQKDLESQVLEHGQRLMFDKLYAVFMENNRDYKIPVKLWKVPFVAPHVQVQREVMTGNFLGTDNAIQLVDTVSVGASGGIRFSPWNILTPVQVGLTVSGGFTRTYTHVMPIRDTLKSALKVPLTKLFIPLVLRRIGGKLNELGSDPEPKRAVELLKLLKKELKAGDSFIITDSIPAGAAFQMGYQIPQAQLSLQGQAGRQGMVIWRTHFHRVRTAAEDKLIIYRDRGEAVGFNYAAGVSAAGVPIFSYSASHPAGSARTKVYRVSLDSDLFESGGQGAATKEAIAEFEKTARAAAGAMITGSTKRLDKIQTPTLIERKFEDSSSRLAFFFWVKRKLGSTSTIRVKTSKGDESSYLDLSKGSQLGRNYFRFANDVASYYLSKVSGGKASFNIEAQPDPGQSFKGSSKTRSVSWQENTTVGREEPFALVSYDQRGWKISRKEIEKRVSELGRRFHTELYPASALADSDAVKFYNLFTEVSVYRRGIDRLEASLSDGRLDTLIDRYRKAGQGGKAGDLNGVREKLQKASREARAVVYKAPPMNLDDPRVKESRARLELISEAERLLDFDDFKQLVGGEENLFVRSRLDGFRIRSEEMLDPIPSNTIGRIGSEFPRGPLSNLQREEGIDPGEFGAYFIKERL